LRFIIAFSESNRDLCAVNGFILAFSHLRNANEIIDTARERSSGLDDVPDMAELRAREEPVHSSNHSISLD
jgi:hypothetical protein